ncbi:hypothetical protein TSA1_01185 [Bradyrhizobium nitroreducens]|uniref:Uncharacterized protein n=1 Tax=Bradyrhizobium nitroreducens TaxID=709803 RepID=A0A2M6U4N3_9BRAD|nr:hypothetical protein [Bradyrhizobium nitroreducens]PIS99524.1 hypothetical protein TSA1_01185 [Bradyrhizobium nitroreducens]
MMLGSFAAGDEVRFQAYTQEAAEVDYATGTVLTACEGSPLLGEWVDIAFGKVIRRGVPTGRLELVCRAPQNANDARWTEDLQAADQARDWPA